MLSRACWISHVPMDRRRDGRGCALSRSGGRSAHAFGEPAHRCSQVHESAGQGTSPYLLLHAHNPVDWYPWGDEALAKAKAEKKLIFLSVGYSSCYWCHVMERESFMDDEIAAKLERELRVHQGRSRRAARHRRDLHAGAAVYLQLVGSKQAGGWPLSMFLTPDAKPLMGGTYFPPRDKDGRMGF